MKKIYVLILGLMIAPMAKAFEGGMNPMTQMMTPIYNQAGMMNMHNMNAINEQRFRQQEAEDWQSRQNPRKKAQPSIEQETTLQKLIDSKKSSGAQFIEENGELKIEHK